MFIGYPALIFLLTKIKKVPKQRLVEDSCLETPSLTIILCIYNASDKLKARLDNVFASDYPEDKLNIIVVSDGSTDNPKEIIKNYADGRVSLLESSSNQGKAHALNIGISNATTEFLAFIDVRQFLDVRALKSLIENFNDRRVGAVSGNLMIQGSDNYDPGLYWKYEKWIREKESDLYSLLGVTGAIYMARKSLISQLPSGTILDDMYIPFNIIKAGYRVKFEPNAKAFDVASSTIAEEFHRKVRTLAGNFQLITQLPWLMSPLKNPVFFQFISHKVLRLVLPYSLIYVFCASFFLEDQFFATLFYCQVLFYCYALLSYFLLIQGKVLPFSSVVVSFCSLSLASLISFGAFLFFPPDKLWKKR